MVFSEYIKSLPNQRQDMIEQLARETQTSKSVVYRWMSGQITPPPVKQTIISNILGIPAEELFPKNNESN